MNIQLARQLAEDDPAAAKALLEQMGRDLEQALDETGKLAHRIYPPLLEAGGLAAALRAAAVSAGVPTHIDVALGADFPPEAAGAVYFCCLEVIEHAGASGSSRSRAQITARDEDGELVFEAVSDGSGAGSPPAPALDRLRDRVEALGGRLTILSEPAGGTRISGSLPLAR